VINLNGRYYYNSEPYPVTEDYKFSKPDILEALRVVEEFVVSMGKLDCIAHNHGREAWEREVVRFLCSHEIDKKMAKVRTTLSKPFCRDLGADDMDELEREMIEVSYWTYAEYKDAQPK
jgi:hypothetical protein